MGGCRSTAASGRHYAVSPGAGLRGSGSPALREAGRLGRVPAPGRHPRRGHNSGLERDGAGFGGNAAGGAGSEGGVAEGVKGVVLSVARTRLKLHKYVPYVT